MSKACENEKISAKSTAPPECAACFQLLDRHTLLVSASGAKDTLISANVSMALRAFMLCILAAAHAKRDQATAAEQAKEYKQEHQDPGEQPGHVFDLGGDHLLAIRAKCLLSVRTQLLVQSLLLLLFRRRIGIRR